MSRGTRDDDEGDEDDDADTGDFFGELHALIALCARYDAIQYHTIYHTWTYSELVRFSRIRGEREEEFSRQIEGCKDYHTAILIMLQRLING